MINTEGRLKRTLSFCHEYLPKDPRGFNKSNPRHYLKIGDNIKVLVSELPEEFDWNILIDVSGIDPDDVEEFCDWLQEIGILFECDYVYDEDGLLNTVYYIRDLEETTYSPNIEISNWREYYRDMRLYLRNQQIFNLHINHSNLLKEKENPDSTP